MNVCGIYLNDRLQKPSVFSKCKYTTIFIFKGGRDLAITTALECIRYGLSHRRHYSIWCKSNDVKEVMHHDRKDEIPKHFRPRTDIDRVSASYLSKYEMQLENAITELKNDR